MNRVSLQLVMFVSGFSFLLGCGPEIVQNPNPVEVTFQVAMGESPLDGVVLNLQPIGNGLQCQAPVAKGEAKTMVTPGSYTYFFTEGKSEAAFKKIPEAFQKGSLDRKIEIDASKAIQLSVN